MNHIIPLPAGNENTYDTSDLVIVDAEPSKIPFPKIAVPPGVPGETVRVIGRVVSRIIGEAMCFVGSWRWYAITKVEVKQRDGCVWIWDDAKAEASIQLSNDAELEVLYHEVYHSAFHDSPLHHGEDEKWGDAWCDAFRYFHDGAFKAKIDRFCDMTFDQARKDGDWNHDKNYAYPCSLIINKCNKDYAEFRRLWFDLCEQRKKTGSDVLPSVFGYDVANGFPVKDGTL